MLQKESAGCLCDAWAPKHTSAPLQFLCSLPTAWQRLATKFCGCALRERARMCVTWGHQGCQSASRVGCWDGQSASPGACFALTCFLICADWHSWVTGVGLRLVGLIFLWERLTPSQGWSHYRDAPASRKLVSDSLLMEELIFFLLCFRVWIERNIKFDLGKKVNWEGQIDLLISGVFGNKRTWM